MDIKEVFRIQLEMYMSVNNINQKELAKMLKVSHTTISNWVNGHKIPRMDKIDKLCKIFKCTRAELLEGDVDGVPKLGDIVMRTDQLELLTYYELLDPMERGRLLGELSIRCKDKQCP